MNNQTIEQKRALSALNRIKEISKEISNKNNEIKKLFSSYINRLPSSIVMNGLGQALAFEKSKSKKDGNKDSPASYAHKLIYETISKWLTSEDGIYNKGEKDLITAIMESDQETYLLAQVEALAYIQWLKMFSASYLGDDNDQ